MNQTLPEKSSRELPLTKISFVLIILLLGALVFLFLSITKIQSQLSFNDKRLNILEESPRVVMQNNTVPEAGESAKIDLLPTATPLQTPLGTKMPSATPNSVAISTPVAKTSITYIPLYGGSAQTSETSWVDVTGSDFQLKASDYGKQAYFNWEAIAYVVGGSGEVRLRIYDLTNNIVVSGSEISGSAAKPTLISSGRLNFFSGNNTYRVQQSSLTSSTVEFDFGRLKVVY